MPRLNRTTGAAIQGNGGPVSIDRRIIAPVGTCAQWLDHRAVYQAYDERSAWVEAFDPTTDTPARLAEEGANFLAAGGGAWAGFRPERGVFGTIGDWPRASLSLVGTDGRGAAGWDGTIAICPNASGSGLLLVRTNGSTYTIPGVIAYGVEVLGSAHAIWNDGAGNITTDGIPRPVSRRGLGPRYVVVNGRAWLVYWALDVGLVAHPADDLTDGRLLTAALAFHHDAIALNGRLVVAYSTGPEEHPEELVVEPDVVNLPRRDLTAPLFPPVQPFTDGRSRLCGYFYKTSTRYGVNPWAPGNCEIVVEAEAIPLVAGAFVPGWTLAAVAADRWHDVPAVFLHCATAEQLIDEAANARWLLGQLGLPLRPILGYLDGPDKWTQPIPGVTWAGIQAYQLATETPTQARLRIERQIRAINGAFALVGQAYDTNDDLTRNLVDWQPIPVDLVHDPNCRGLFWFSDGRDDGSGRGGVRVHEEIRPYHRAVAEAIGPRGPIEEEDFMQPFRIGVPGYGKVIERGRDYHAFVTIGNGLEIEIQKDERDSLHFAVYRDGVLQDRSGLERHVEVRG